MVSEVTQVLKTTDKQNFAQVVELLKLEAAAIELAAARLESAQVERALEVLSCCKSKVVVLGVGKSGIVAQKIAATMTSTGTIAVFLHPTDALHGGLGILIETDVVIALSNSGETAEIIALLPTLKKRGVKIVAIVGNTNSTLSRQADVVLDASVDQEACPLNLAPTASTTVALVIGDALAMTLMQMKNLTAEDFAVNHPAGNLGKRLTLRVADLMHKGEQNPQVLPTASWFEVVRAISRYALGAVNVINLENELIGIVTDGDLRRAIEKIDPQNLKDLTAQTMMTQNPIVARPEMLAYNALQLMENRPQQISVLPVVETNNRCLGLLRLHDIVRSGL